MTYKFLFFTLALFLNVIIFWPESKPNTAIPPQLEVVIDTLYPYCGRCGWDTMLYLHTDPKEILR